MRKIIFCIFITVIGLITTNCQKSYTWYVEPEFKATWERIIRESPPPQSFIEIKTWEGGIIPKEPGFLIAFKPWLSQEKVSVYNRLPYTLEFQGARLLALDPWMVFRKHREPGLSVNRAYSQAGGDGTLLIPGRESTIVEAWTARLVQERPGVFPSEDHVWQEAKNNLFSGNRFPRGAETYTWQDVFFRLLGNETAWVYAPLSVIRLYPNPRKSILEASAFPERVHDQEAIGQYSLQASLLWALPLGSEYEKEQLAQTYEWLKSPEIQTLIANTLGWIPANPYGTPFDPISFVSHRHWLTASYVYEINE